MVFTEVGAPEGETSDREHSHGKAEDTTTPPQTSSAAMMNPEIKEMASSREVFSPTSHVGATLADQGEKPGGKPATQDTAEAIRQT